MKRGPVVCAAWHHSFPSRGSKPHGTRVECLLHDNGEIRVGGGRAVHHEARRLVAPPQWDTRRALHRHVAGQPEHPRNH
eukprot:3474692-Prymnesium_polylepis.2